MADHPERARPSEPRRPNYLLHAGLFAATCATTYAAGGLAFSATLMTILVVHEMGHYVAARIHGVPASLPFFVPLPPQISLGTLGAVIKMDEPIVDRNKLIDVGAAGPLAGLVAAIPLLAIGLWLSPLSATPTEGTYLEGNSILYIALKYLITGQYLPAADGTDVVLHPMAFAAWVGLLITMINLIPIGQLDGGHVARAFLGNRHERFSGQLHWALLAVGVSVAGYLAYDAHAGGFSSGVMLRQAAAGGMPWLVGASMLLVMRWMSGGAYHPPVGDAALTPARRRLVVLTAVVFVLIFTPIPLRPALIP
ncbi:MAG TPA: site-2 protease family protein [Kofleriaceae bacterium]|nr:site-2 protease family protein [Kofleriaceae bacterium]